MKKFFTQTILLLAAILITTSANAIAQGDIRLDLYRISDQCIPGGALLSSYTLSSRNSFITTNGDLYVAGEIWNTTNNVITLDPSKILVSFDNGASPYTPTVYNGGGEKITTLTLRAHDYSSIIIKIPENWSFHTKKTSDNYPYLDFYFKYVGNNPILQLFTGSYCVTNGKSKSKAIESSSAQNIYVQPIRVSRGYNGPYEDIMQYRPYTGKYYYMGGDNLNVLFSIKNKTNQSITFNSNSFEINYGTQNLYNIHGVANESNTIISSFTVPANETINVIFHLGNEWYDNRENASNPGYYQPVSLFLYYNGTKTDGISYSYLFSRTNSKSISVFPSAVTSNVTIKSIDNFAIKSIRVVGTMGDLVKSQSYGNNSMEANIDLSNCKNGIYYIQVEKTTGVETAKIIKK